MSRSDWQTLERLCRKALLTVIAEPDVPAGHPVEQAVRTTGAFAAAVADGMAQAEEHA